MSQADNLLRRLDVLESALTLKKAGVPDRLIGLCYSDKPEDIEEAKQQILDRYDNPPLEVLEAAGSTVEVASFSWAAGRGVGITSNLDPAIPETIKEQVNTNLGGRELPPVVGTKQFDYGFENPKDPD